MSAVIGASHVLCAIGSGTEQVWASARAGIARIGSSPVEDRYFEPIQMGLVPEQALDELTAEIAQLPLPARARRILRLAAPSLRTVAAGAGGAVSLFIGLPQLVDEDARWLGHVPAYLQRLTGIEIDRTRSQIVPLGRAAALVALEQALHLLAQDPSATVIVGGVDSYFDVDLLVALEREQRILGATVMDGFIPGEGAAFFRLLAARQGEGARQRQVVVSAAASVADPGHRYGDAPALGEGLAVALTDLRGRWADATPIAVTFAGFNGESFDAKLWGVARVRHHDFFDPGMPIEHPADKFGDTGAATGAILVALAAQSLASATRPGPALVWAASDRETRACAVLSLTRS